MSQTIELSNLVATFVKPASRGGSNKLVEVKFDPSVSRAEYTVYTLSSEISGPNACRGCVESAADGNDISFTFPVVKKSHYMLQLVMRVDGVDHHAQWVLDPIKRRTVTKEDVAPDAAQ